MRKYKTMFSFFQFYLNVLKNNPKKYELAMNHKTCYAIFVTPVAFFVLFLLSMGFYMKPSLYPLMYLWIPIIIGNLIFSMKVRDEAYEIRREKDRLEREEREKKRKEVAETREKRRRIEQIEWERMNRASTRSNEAIKETHIHKNLQNAMNLLGLQMSYTETEVKSAYRRLSKLHHPDQGGLETNFIRLNNAYTYLMNNLE